MALWLKQANGTLVPVGGVEGEHVLTGDPLNPPVEWEVGQLLWDDEGDTGGPALMLQHGSFVYDGISSSGAMDTQTFPKAYASAPNVTAIVGQGNSGVDNGYYVKQRTLSATSFALRGYDTNGYWDDSQAMTVYWVAVGEPLDPLDANMGTGPQGPKGDKGDLPRTGFTRSTVNVDIASATSGAPTYITGTYIVPSPTGGEPYDRTFAVNGVLTVNWDSGATVNGRVVYGVIGMRIGYNGGTGSDVWEFPVPYCISPAIGFAATQQAASVPINTNVFVPAGDSLELRLYAWRNGGSTNTAIANHCTVQAVECQSFF